MNGLVVMQEDCRSENHVIYKKMIDELCHLAII